MELKSYTGILLTMALVPGLVVFIILCIMWCCNRKSEGLMLIIMKNIISKKNINKKLTYLVCHRELSSSQRWNFMIVSIFIICICVQSFFAIAIVDVSYECINDPNLDCFKKKDDIKITDTFVYNESPVNCSSISRDDFVLCYRITAFDPERAFIGAAAAYLLFKMFNFSLHVVAHIMLWVVQKWGRKTVLYSKIALNLFFTIVLFVPLILRTYLDEVESALRQLSYIAFFQAGVVLLVVGFFVTQLPWEEFQESEEYFGDASLPSNVDAHDNEMN